MGKKIVQKVVQFTDKFEKSIMDLKDMTKPSGTDQSIPYVISPRLGFLDTRRPKLRWNKVKGATSYTVKIVADSKIIWEQTVKEAEFNSSDDLPLKAGVDYWLIVESDNGRSSQMDSDQSKLKFQLLDEDKIKSLPDDVKKITDLGLTDDEETLELANLYFGKKYGLITKAIEMLDKRIAANSQTSEIYVTAGNLNRVAGLNSFAKEQYKKALQLIKSGKELEEEILAKTGLSEICILLGNEKEANRLKQEVKADLKTLSINRQSGAIADPSRARAVTRMSCDCPDCGKFHLGECIPKTCIC